MAISATGGASRGSGATTTASRGGSEAGRTADGEMDSEETRISAGATARSVAADATTEPRAQESVEAEGRKPAIVWRATVLLA
jgi:hypothetical protein